MRATDRCRELRIHRGIDCVLLLDSQVEDAVIATSAKHMCDVCAAESVSSAVVQRSQRTQIRALYFVKYASLPSLFDARRSNGRIQWSLHVPIIFMTIPLWHSCLPSHRSNNLFCVGGMAPYHLYSCSPMGTAV
jgi:hypothetical protein